MPRSESLLPSFVEPPPLEEWLQGRKILTVKQDGSAMFTQIQAALNALKPGEVVEVLDKGPYQERLVVGVGTNRFTPDDTGLISRIGTVLRVPEWHPALGADAAVQFQGHLLFNSGTFRLNGFVFATTPTQGGCELYVTAANTVLEDCDFVSYVPQDGPKLYRSFQCGFWDASNSGRSLRIRNCSFAGQVHLGSYQSSDSPTTITLTKNYFYSALNITNKANRSVRIECIMNAFAGNTAALISGGLLDAPTACSFRKNTVTSPRLFLLSLAADQIFDLDAGNNLCPSVAFTLNEPSIDLKPLASKWRVDRNAFPAFPTGDFGVISRDTNFIGPIEFLSTDPRDRNYLRLKPDSVLANLPAAPGEPTYIGALPPGPAPPEGDWFTRLMHRWLAAQEDMKRMGLAERPESGDERPEGGNE